MNTVADIEFPVRSIPNSIHKTTIEYLALTGVKCTSFYQYKLKGHNDIV